MNIKKLNEKLQKYVVNEISDELADKVSNIRKDNFISNKGKSNAKKFRNNLKLMQNRKPTSNKEEKLYTLADEESVLLDNATEKDIINFCNQAIDDLKEGGAFDDDEDIPVIKTMEDAKNMARDFAWDIVEKGQENEFMDIIKDVKQNNESIYFSTKRQSGVSYYKGNIKILSLNDKGMARIQFKTTIYVPSGYPTDSKMVKTYTIFIPKFNSIEAFTKEVLHIFLPDEKLDYVEIR